MTRVNLYLDETLWLAFRKACLEQHTSASKAIEQLIRQQLTQWQATQGESQHD